MSTTAKVVLGILGGLLLLSLLSCLGLKLWIDANKDELMNMGVEAEAEGVDYGVGSDQSGCVGEGLSRLELCGEFDPMCEAENGIFLKSCLSAASPSEGFCDGVPAKNDILESATWAVGTCVNLGRAQDQACGRMLQSVQDHCHGR